MRLWIPPNWTDTASRSILEAICAPLRRHWPLSQPNSPEYAGQVYKLYQRPSWKIRVGNFYREIDAQELLQAVREFFPEAFVVSDKIELPDLPDPSE